MALKLISWCWDIFILFWVINMFSNKRTVRRQSRGSRLLYTVPFVISFWLLFASFSRHGRPPYNLVVVPHSFALNGVSVALAVLGLALAIWARVTLGRNWSGTVTFKENHELVVRGPYALARHPIYTGMLLMFLGTALAAGTLGALMGLPLNFLSFWIKFRQEETLMIENFGDQYLAYRKRVKALIPLVF
jgi:protein-S-isoprenylcysteine O-methyltransferase Ste14